MAAADSFMAVVIPLNPVPASRPRVGRWGVHYLKTYSDWMKQAALHLPTDDVHFPKGTPIAVMTEIVVKKAKTTKREWPIGDVDNYLKAIWDAITKSGSVWADDDQVVMDFSYKRYVKPGEEPHAKVSVMSVDP